MEETYCDALRFAIEFEKKSEEFYKKASERVCDDFAKKALDFIAADEVTHTKRIKAFNRALIKNNDFDLETECRSNLSEQTDEFIDEFINKEGDKITTDSNDLEIYDVALDMEKRGYDAYKNASIDAKEDPRVQRFFKFLAEQEIVHYKLLQESKKYLEDSSYYFEDYGGWVFNE